MAERKVSVRLVAENGRQVRAELQGVGEAGARGFRTLKSEVDVVSVVLAKLAGMATAALGPALTLVTTATIRAAAEAQQLATVANAAPDQFQRWAGATRAVGIEEEKLADILKDVNDRVGDFMATGGGPMADFFENIAPRVGVTAEQFARLSGPDALQLYVDSLEKAGVGQQEMTFYLEAMASDLTRMLPLLRNGGSEMDRLGQRAADLGVVMDNSTIATMQKAQIALSGVGMVFEGMRNQIGAALAPALTDLSNRFVDLASTGGIIHSAFQNFLINMERVGTYAATLAAFMGGRWVAGFVAARVATFSLATALTALRGALIRTGIGAIIVAAGELIYQFTRLVERVGGMADAFRALGALAAEIGGRIGMAFQASFALMGAGWEGFRALVFTVLDGIVAGTAISMDRYIALYAGAFEAVKAIWGALPGAIGDLAFQAANGLIAGVEAMLNGVVTRINNFIGGINAALAVLPDWAVGEGGAQIGQLDPFSIGRINNPFAGGATEAGASAADAFADAFGRSYVGAPDLFGNLADQATTAAAGYLDQAAALGEAATRPLESWSALTEVVTTAGEEGAAAMDSAAGAADRTAEAFDGAGGAAGRAAAAGKKAGKDAKEGADEAKTGWDAVAASLTDYANQARDIGGGIGNALAGAFQSAENAVGDFVTKGKISVSELATSIIADFARIGARRFLLGPLAGALNGALGALGGGIMASVLHSGGMVGSGGTGRNVSAMAFANAPRMHSGGWAGLRSDEVPAILQRGERVLSRREAAGYGSPVTVNIAARDAESFRQSRAQISTDIARAVAMGRRSM
ncbi:phage tail tape measure C-terminal domain-containing protein [Paracoccus sp. PAR01]|uniref:phage tail tape measure C-terminal domain-containing protein n=1 Tax=Paracoccus sp. PAR01 TaxID=2769282 RepID=UPI00177ED8FF|nr:phage tail tape measure C-terminal domain-containing protein [Paracoccus sp. PAR01]MBD9529119.1 phage tail tape measure protein [Paracoccus sp. PAR01]